LLISRGVDLFRSKGVLYFEKEKSPFVFQAVHMLMSGNIDREATFPVDGSLPENRLIFIGRNLDREELTKGFKECIAS
jgi:G3E family GTPase